jgi:alkylhydroperoxidase/carboxymuconolactone decarboxylase family protein YurZ
VTDAQKPTPAQKLIGDFTPKLISLTDDVSLRRHLGTAELSPRDRSLITVASLITGGNTEQLPGRLERAKQNGLTETKLKEAIIHLALRRMAQGDVRHHPGQAGLRRLTTAAGSREKSYDDDDLDPRRAEHDRRRGRAADRVTAARRHATPVRDDLGDDLYIRSAYGSNNPWFRRAKASGAGRIRADGLERDVTFAEAPPGVHKDIDNAYHAKYDRYGPAIVGTVVGDHAAAVTIRLVPRPA